MGQMSFSDAEHAGKRKKTRRKLFLEEMEQVIPWMALRRPVVVDGVEYDYFSLADAAIRHRDRELCAVRSAAEDRGEHRGPRGDRAHSRAG